MIPYYEELMPEEQLELTGMIRLLYKQTFILERRYDRRTERYQYNKDFRTCNKHLEFIREYLKIAGVEIRENSQMGVFYIQGEGQVGDKLPRLATLYILILKLIYDEQMASVSNSVHIITTLSEMNERLGSNMGLLTKNPAPTEIRRAISLLKKYQLIEPLDMMEGMEPQSRLIIYPSINVVLFGDDARGILASFAEDTEHGRGGNDGKEALADGGTGSAMIDRIADVNTAGTSIPEEDDTNTEGGDGDDEEPI